MKNMIKALAAAVIILAFGAAAVFGEEENTLIISYEADGAVFDIYRAGEFNEDLTFSLSGDFAAYADSLNLKGLSAGGWTAAAETLYNYALTDKMTPLSSAAVTDGKAEFSWLDRGLYLVSGSEVTTGGYTYTSETFLVCLPNLDENSEWTNTVALSPKFSKESDSEGGGGGGKIAELFSLLIIWTGDNEDVRPEKVVYTIYRDGEVYAVVTISDENNWQYELTGLEVGYTWTVTQEGLPEGYTTTVESTETDDGTAIVINNIYSGTAADTSSETTTEASAEATTKASSGGSGGGGGGGSSVIIGDETTTEAPETEAETEGTSQDLSVSSENTENTDEDNKGNTDGEGSEEGEASDDGALSEAGVLPGSSSTADTIGGGETSGLSSDGSSSGAAAGSESDGETLPQTGQLWLPVPILVFCGLILFIIGYIRYKRNDDEG